MYFWILPTIFWPLLEHVLSVRKYHIKFFDRKNFMIKKDFLFWEIVCSSILGNMCRNMCPIRLTAHLPSFRVFVSYKKHVWICKIDWRLMNGYYLLQLRSDSIFLTNPYGQCEFPNASGCFLIDSLMRGSSMVFRPNPHHQDRLVFVYKPFLLGLSEKTQVQLKLLPFPTMFNFFFLFKKSVKFTSM